MALGIKFPSIVANVKYKFIIFLQAMLLLNYYGSHCVAGLALIIQTYMNDLILV